MFYKRNKNDKVVVLIVYVNDIILTENDETRFTTLKKDLVNDFQSRIWELQSIP